LTSVSLARAQPRGAYAAPGESGRKRTFQRALRHSRRVRRLRVGLPIALALILLGLVVEYYLPLRGLRLPVEIGSMVIKGTKITMQEPRLAGFTSDGRPYSFRARAAAQDITRPDLVELRNIRAKMAMADKSMVHLWADSGLMNMKANTLTLNDNVRLVSSTGYQARLEGALVNMSKGSVASNKPVWVKLLDGVLTAKRLHIVDKGEVVRFTDVKMTLRSSGPMPGGTQP
jgi:lipopolysaccharide export system protein LptC